MEDERSLFRRLLSEPAVHFVAVAVVIFAAHALLATESGPTTGDDIVVDEETVQQLEKRFRRQHGRSPTADELRGAIGAWTRREMLVREAIASGLHRVDPIVRRRLAQAMRMAVEPEERQPSEEQLREFYRRHRERYRRPARVSFRHVYLRDCTGDERLSCGERAERVLRQLRTGASPDRFGAPFTEGRVFSGATPADLRDTFGAGFFRRLQELSSGRWVGPVRSSVGEHLVYIRDVSAARVAPFEEVRRQVGQEFRESRADARSSEVPDRVREAYRVRLEVDLEAGGRR